MVQFDIYMPDSCRECWFLNYDMYSGRTSCAIEDMTLAEYFKALDFEGRHEECPLIDVPDNNVGNISEFPNSSTDCISRQAAIDALWKALYKYEDKTEKQFQDSDELDVCDWFVHRLFVQNMSDIDRQTILELPSAQPEIVRCKDCRYVWNEDGWDNLWCNRLTGSFSVEKDGGCSWGKI